MKKTYIMPAAKFRNVKINHILSGSTADPTGTTPTETQTGVIFGTSTPTDAGSGEEAAGKGGWLDFD